MRWGVQEGVDGVGGVQEGVDEVERTGGAATRQALEAAAPSLFFALHKRSHAWLCCAIASLPLIAAALRPRAANSSQPAGTSRGHVGPAAAVSCVLRSQMWASRASWPRVSTTPRSRALTSALRATSCVVCWRSSGMGVSAWRGVARG